MATHRANAAPWEPQGYPRLARVMAEHPQLAIIRRFETFAHISLISLQAQLIVAQRDCQESCKKCDISASEEDTRLTGDSLELMDSSSNNGLELQKALQKLRQKTSEYNVALLQAHQVSQLPLVNTGHYSPIETLQEWHYRKTHGRPREDRCARILHSRILKSSLRHLDPGIEDQDPVSRKLTPALINLYHWLWKGRAPAPDIESQDGLYDYQYSKLKRVARTLATIIASALPILALYFIHSLLQRIYVMIALTIVFAAAISAFTPANMVEVFASTSAFAAVEVVFIGSTALS